MAERFHINCALAPGPIHLDGPEAHHLAAVCRARPGDRVYLFNGDGRQYLAEVAAIGRRQVDLHILAVETPQRELGFRLEVAAPLPRGDRAQFLVEKLTELGVTSFVPLRTARSVVEPREARLERLQRHVIEASKQCGRNVLMHIAPLADWKEYCRRPDLPPLRRVAHPGAERGTRSAELSVVARSGSGVALAVGPEGGYTEEEIGMAVAAGWQVLDLGPRILRVETAALALAALSGLAHQ
jgi:16S rRNA (uracil1498-N3)-methyltransferase